MNFFEIPIEVFCIKLKGHGESAAQRRSEWMMGSVCESKCTLHRGPLSQVVRR